MITVVWTFTFPAPAPKAALAARIKAAAPLYVGVPGLIRKYFGIGEDGASMVGVYLWESRRAADAFYTPAWLESVSQRAGVTPTRVTYETPVVVESRAGRIEEAA